MYLCIYIIYTRLYIYIYIYIHTHELRVNIHGMSYETNFTYELRVTVYCTMYYCNVDCVKFQVSLLYRQVSLVSYSRAMYFINMCSNDSFMCKTSHV